MEETFAVLAEAFATITLRGQLSSGAFIQVANVRGAIFLGSNCLRRNNPGAICPSGQFSSEAIIQGAIIQWAIIREGAIFPGGNYNWEQFPGGQ